MGIPHTVFEAAVIYATELEKTHSAKGYRIRMFLDKNGIKITLRGPQFVECERLVSWHDIEHAQYDALRLNLDTVIEMIERGREKGHTWGEKA